MEQFGETGEKRSQDIGRHKHSIIKVCKNMSNKENSKN